MEQQGVGIDRGHYIALRTPDPASATEFAAANMGMDLVHADEEGRHYLSAHGLDAYSLVYTPGENGIDHISYLLKGGDPLTAAEQLTAAGVSSERIDESEMWRHGPAVRFQGPGGLTIELTTGVNVDVPMNWRIDKPAVAPAPISMDHVIVRSTDPQAMIDFAAGPLGLKESGRIVRSDGVPFLTFFRSHTIFHCFGVNASEYDGMNHAQFTLKNDRAVFEAYEAMKEAGRAELVWGPVRHGCGQNITFYFLDYAGNVIEYSAEEEIILDDETYVVNEWSITDGRAVNEWGDEPPPAVMK
jgi:catechol 2,3-dioxygenase-like lactoylglutathione lyase family enzyme